MPAHLRIVTADEPAQRDPITGSTSHAAWLVMRSNVSDPAARFVALVLAVTHAGDPHVSSDPRRLAEQTGMSVPAVEAALTTLELTGHLTGVRGSQVLRT